MLQRIAVRVRALFRRRAVEAELDEELQYHLDREVERGIANGLSPADARIAARRALGSSAYVKDAMRDAFHLRWVEHVRQDVRFALRGFRRAPSFVVTVVLTVALALGLNTTVFTIFDAYVLRPLAVRDAGSLYQVFFDDRRGEGRRLSSRQVDDLRTRHLTAESFAFAPAFARVEGRPMFGNLVTGDALEVLGARPALGRLLLPDDDRASGGQPVIVVGYDAWQGKFGGDSGIVGKRVFVRGEPLTVIGVTAKDFTGIGPIPLDFWVPMSRMQRARSDRDLPGVNLVVRLRPDMDARRAAAMLATWASHETAAQPDSLRIVRARLESLHSRLALTPETIAMFAPAAVAFALVLLIACANVANVMLARGLARQREIGIHLALGAERARLVRQLLTESVLLAAPAALLGYLLSRWTIAAGVRLLFATAPGDYAPYLRVIPFTPDLRIFSFLLLVALAAALLFGLVPALQATRPNVLEATRGDFDAGLRAGHLRASLVVTQIVVCSLLLIVTGILLRGSAAVNRIDTGMRTAGVVQVDLDDRARAAALPRLRDERAVEDLGATTQSPLDGSYPSFGMRAEGDRRVVVAGVDFVDAGFFRVLDIPLLHGRAFSAEEERHGAPVAIVNAAAARAFWPRADAVGQVVQLDGDPPRDSRLARVRSARVIGVSANAVSGWIGTGLDRPVVFFPISADSAGARIVARVSGDAYRVRDQIDRDVSAADAGAIDELHPLDEYLAVQRWPFRTFSWVSAAIGAIALLLTLVGVYGVLAYLVAQRTREIGIRIALGASVDAVVGLVVRQSFRYALAGVAVGTVLALAVSRLFASILFILDPFDPLGYAAGIGVVLVACIAAAYAPSRRAARVNPVEALRAE